MVICLRRKKHIGVCCWGGGNECVCEEQQGNPQEGLSPGVKKVSNQRPGSKHQTTQHIVIGYKEVTMWF